MLSNRSHFTVPAILGLALAIPAITARADFYLIDDFNRANGPVGNGFSQFGNASIVGQALATRGQNGVGGGIFLQGVDFTSLPIQFSFDVWTNDIQRHTPFIAMGTSNVNYLGDPRVGGRSVFAVGLELNSGVPNLVSVSIMGRFFDFEAPLIPAMNQVLRVQGTLFSDLSSEYSFDLDADGLGVTTISRGAVAPLPGFAPGNRFILGNSQGTDVNAVTTFDNLRVISAVPEPSTLVLSSIGGMTFGLVACIRRRRVAGAKSPSRA